MGPRLRGQSEVVGVILLIGVTVTLVFGIGAVVLSNWQSQTDEQTRVDVHSTMRADNVTLEQQGGDTLDAEDVTVILRGDSEEQYTLENATQDRGSDASQFEPGDRWVVEHDVSGDSVRLLVVHDPTNDLLHTETATID